MVAFLWINPSLLPVPYESSPSDYSNADPRGEILSPPGGTGSVSHTIVFRNKEIWCKLCKNHQRNVAVSIESSVVDPKLFFSDPDPIFRRVLDPDPDPT
jgi:hypothetical protein